jgi:hypothetical protein
LFHDQGAGDGNAHANGQTNEGSVKHTKSPLSRAIQRPRFWVVLQAEKIVRYVMAMVCLHDLRGCWGRPAAYDAGVIKPFFILTF